MKNYDSRIISLMSEFRIPQRDAFERCLFVAEGDVAPDWSSAIYISRKGEEVLYADIAEFWVRSFFSLLEDIGLYQAMSEAALHVHSQNVSPEFCRAYLSQAKSLHKDENCDAGLYDEVMSRSIGSAFLVLDGPRFRSFVASSGDDYISYFLVLPSSKVP